MAVKFVANKIPAICLSFRFFCNEVNVIPEGGKASPGFNTPPFVDYFYFISFIIRLMLLLDYWKATIPLGVLVQPIYE